MLAAPSFSIITVCRNAEAAIGATVSSLIGQSISDYELVVIDGASTDGTLAAVRQLTLGLNLQIVSEPDGGIYDAMNKGVRLSRGKWLYFLNAGDRFIDQGVLERTLDALNKSLKSELGYGDVCYGVAGQQRMVRFDWLTKRNLIFENLCHQGVFARRDLFDRMGGFNTRFRINADFDWLLRVFYSGAHLTYLGFPIALYEGTGFSERELKQRVIERELVRQQYMPRLIKPLLDVFYRIRQKVRRICGVATR